MKIKNIMMAAAMLLTAIGATAQNPEAKALKGEFNYRRGMEYYDQYDYETAQTYFQKAYRLNPKNFYAKAKEAECYVKQNKYNEALEAYASAESAAKDDYELLTDIHYYCSLIYINLELFDNAEKEALKCVDASLKSNPTSAYGYTILSAVHLERDTQKSVKYAKMAIETDPSYLNAYKAAAEQMCKLGADYYDDAEKIADNAIKLYSDDNELKMIKAQILALKGQYNKAIDMAISVLSNVRNIYRSYDANKFLCCDLTNYCIDMDAVRDAHFDENKFRTLVDIKLRDKMQQQPNSAKWPMMLGIAKATVNDNESAAEYFGVVESISPNNTDAIYRRAYCLMDILDFDGAMAEANNLIAIDTTAAYAYALRAQVKERMGANKLSVVEDYTKAINYNPSATNYYVRAWYERYNGMLQQAAEDMATAVEMDGDNPHYRLALGNILGLMGEKEMAREEYEKGLKIVTDKKTKDEADEDLKQKAYFLMYMGKTDEAVETMKKAVEKATAESEDGGYYDLACLYSLMGRTDDALEALAKCFEWGYTQFHHVRRDNDLDNLRKAKGKDYEALVAKYEQQTKDKFAKKSAPEEAHSPKGHVAEIHFNHEGGVLTVPCVINGLPLSFIFDSGAADVTLSLVEANFMYKNGYIKKSDLGDREYYGTADGGVGVGTRLLLRSVTFGGETLTNVWASVVESQRAPLLLGQTVMKRLGQVEIDNTKQVIRIKN